MPAAAGVRRPGVVLPVLVECVGGSAFFLTPKGSEGTPCRAKEPAAVEGWL